VTERPSETSEADIAALAATVKAPDSLHRQVQEMIADAQRRAPARRRLAWPTRPRRLTVALAGAALAGVLAVVLAVTLPGTGRSSSLAQRTVALTLAPATAPAPSESASDRGELSASVGGTAFPYWKERFGWRGSGARTDRLGSRAVTTVFYSNAAGQRIGYAIVSGRAPAPDGGSVVWRWGVPYRLSSSDGANVIVWRRDGHLCVMAGRGVGRRTLLALASWRSDRDRPRAA
jgi:hypothetical protein